MHKNQSGFAHVVLLGLVVLVLVGGVGVYVMNSNKKPAKSNSETSETASNLAEPLPSDLLTVDKVKELAATEVPNVELSGVELEKEEGVFLYKVKFANGTVILFNAQTGAKVTQSEDQIEADENEAAEVESEKDASIPASFAAAISFDKAREIALAAHVGTISKIELETEEGKVVYSVRYSDDARVDVDATTGAVVRNDAAKTTTTESGSSSGGSGNNGSDD